MEEEGVEKENEMKKKHCEVKEGGDRKKEVEEKIRRETTSLNIDV